MALETRVRVSDLGIHWREGVCAPPEVHAAPSGEQGMPRTQRSHSHPKAWVGAVPPPLLWLLPGACWSTTGTATKAVPPWCKAGGSRGGGVSRIPWPAPRGTAAVRSQPCVKPSQQSGGPDRSSDVCLHSAHIYICIALSAPLKSMDWLPPGSRSPCEILSTKQSNVSPKHPPITYKIQPPPPPIFANERIGKLQYKRQCQPRGCTKPRPTRAELHVFLVPHR